MKTLFAALLLCCFALNSCSFVPTPDGHHAILVGGKGHLEYGAGGVMAYTYTNEKSFQHATQAITTVAGTWAMAAVSKATEVTKQVSNTNAAGVAKAADANATAVKLGEQGVTTTKAGLDAGAFAKEATTFTQPK